MQKIPHTISFFFFLVAGLASAQIDQGLKSSVDSIVMGAIKSEAFPGGVLQVMKGKDVIFHQAYGHHTYDSIRQVQKDDIYDLASITKVAGATLALMKLYEQGLFRLDDPIGDYLSKVGRKVGRVTFREALAHQGGLYPWIPFHAEVRRKNGKYKCKSVSSQQNEDYPYALSDSLFLHAEFYSKIKKMIRKSDVSREKKYRYSGLFFYLIPELVKNLSGMDYKAYLEQYFYEPLGVETLIFNPTEKFSLYQIAPTEIDTFFRHEMIHGKVHDEGAIMMQGVSGNAGLFGNSIDLSKLFRMLLEGGRVDSLRLLEPATVALFTTAQYPGNDNRRGLGFDKPLLDYDSVKSSVAEDASYRSFGHTGYTGSIVWADPESELIFIFLTNRVYPSRQQKAIYELNVRPNLHQLFYDVLGGEGRLNADPVETVK